MHILSLSVYSLLHAVLALRAHTCCSPRTPGARKNRPCASLLGFRRAFNHKKGNAAGLHCMPQCLGLSMAVGSLYMAVAPSHARLTYRMHTHTCTRRNDPTPALSTRAPSTRGSVRSFRCWPTRTDAAMAIVASHHSEHNSEARATGERVDVGALGWLTRPWRARGAASHRM